MHRRRDQNQVSQLLTVIRDVVGDLCQVIIVLEIIAAVLLYEIHKYAPLYSRFSILCVILTQ